MPSDFDKQLLETQGIDRVDKNKFNREELS
jgi:hypothetical protein